MARQVTDYERIGGEAEVRRVVRCVVDQFFQDFIIGFLFQGRDRERIIAHEVEHASRHLGAEVAYTGRPVGAVHRPLRINRGQFRRRLAILRTVLLREGVAPDIVERWVEADAALERAITDGSDCLD